MKLAEQIEQCTFDRRDGVNRRAQIEGLNSAPASIAVAETFTDGIENRVVAAKVLADDKGFCLFERLTDFFTAGNFADSGLAGGVFQDDNIAREERPVRAAQIEQHAVVSGNRDDEHFGDDWRAGHRIVGWIAAKPAAIKRGCWPGGDFGASRHLHHR